MILNVRLPRILLAGVCGAGLAICGVALQTLFRNPLVSPKVLGLSSGSALGGSLAILAGVGGPLLMGATFVSAFAALFLVVLISNMAGRTLMTIVLAGIVIDALFAAGISLVQSRNEFTCHRLLADGKLCNGELGKICTNCSYTHCQHLPTE